MLKPVTSCEFVEIQIKDTVTNKYYFPELLQLRGRKIKHIISVGQNLFCPSGNTVISDVNYNSSYLTLVSKGREEINAIPISSLGQQYSYGSTPDYVIHESPVIIDKVIDWPKSYVHITNISAITAITKSIGFLVLYENSRIMPKPADLLRFSKNTIKVETIEIQLFTATKKIHLFPDNEKLRGKKILRIEQLVDTGFSPIGNTISTNAAGFLKLNVAGKEEINNLPNRMCWRKIFANNPINLNFIKVDWPKSYIEFSTAMGGANTSILFNVYYKD